MTIYQNIDENMQIHCNTHINHITHALRFRRNLLKKTKQSPIIKFIFYSLIFLFATKILHRVELLNVWGHIMDNILDPP